MTEELQKIGVRFFAEEPAPPVELVEFIPIFHRWIRTRGVDGLLIDVADYTQVSKGPGIVLIGHEADHGVDRADGRLGLVYLRKRPLPGSLAARLRAIARSALGACRALEEAPELGGRVRFRGDEVRIFANDRLLAPNDAATAASLTAPFAGLVSALFGGAPQAVDREPDPRERFALAARAAAPADVSTLLLRLGA